MTFPSKLESSVIESYSGRGITPNIPTIKVVTKRIPVEIKRRRLFGINF